MLSGVVGVTLHALARINKGTTETGIARRWEPNPAAQLDGSNAVWEEVVRESRLCCRCIKPFDGPTRTATSIRKIEKQWLATA